ncbi:hypothetical protein K5X82_16375 [Halosquirtibacter xylanolyticus]|uniref:Ppx/GppA phosphatase family protein n=1 Tax=Halosquirtibacter xylanolyticus TaxID=3374599 RepID=UPI003747FDE0|nr:hypothetical protein K5X82_16375 [Prolixibacteraceae bacterium]
MKTAVVDLGTNTCTLLIGEIVQNKLISHYKESIPVRLGADENYRDNCITNRGIENILSALSEHYQVALMHGIKTVNIYATAAIREANNCPDIVKAINQNKQFKLTILTGAEEANITSLAILKTIDKTIHPILSMDIGGGSNEFVLIQNGEIIWSKSFKTGMARILQRFPFEDKIGPSTIKEISDYFQEQHDELWKMIAKHQPKTLIGSSGAFDTYVDLITYKKPISHLHKLNQIELNDFSDLYSKLISSTREERKNIPGMVPIRETMIVYASLLTNLVLSNSNISKIHQTGYALAEGALFSITQ